MKTKYKFNSINMLKLKLYDIDLFMNSEVFNVQSKKYFNIGINCGFHE